jgi:hypothetical protein
MRTTARAATGTTRLHCEALETRVTPALAYALSGVSAGTATLLSFDTAAPTTATPTTVTGLVGSESLVGIDFRPATGELYALGVDPGTGNGTLYRIDPGAGAATVVGAPGGVDVTAGTDAVGADVPLTLASRYGLDFNPTVDQIRVVFGANSFRLDPTSGAFLGSNGDINGAATALQGSAYTNNQAGAAATTLYGISSETDALYTQSAGTGTTAVVGTALDVNAATVGGFDIPGGVDASTAGALADGTGFAALTVAGVTGLYTVDLTAGTAVLKGTIGNGTADVRGLAVAPAGAVAFESATYSVTESEQSATITFTRTGGSAGALSVSVEAVGGTATAGTDFPGGPYTVNFAAGQTTATLTVPVADDAVLEESETILLVISTVSGAGVVGAVNTATLTVADDEASVAFQSAKVSGNEGPNGVDVVLTRTGGTAGPLSVTVNVTGGTATAGTDFTGGSYTVNFADGQTTATLNVPFSGDAITDAGETVVLTITEVDGTGSIGTTSTTTVTVGDRPQLIAQAFGTGATLPSVRVKSSNGDVIAFNPYGERGGGVRVALGDVTGDGLTDLVTVPAAGAPLVNVYSGADGRQVASFYAYPETFNLPASLAVGDLNNDGFADIVVGTNTTLSAVLVFSGQTLGQMGMFMAFGAVPVGANVAVGDTDGDGQKDIIVGTATGLSVVGVFDGNAFAMKDVYLPFGAFTGGTTVAAGDLDGDGRAEVVVGTVSTVPIVAVYRGSVQKTVFFPFGRTATGVNVAVNDVNGDGQLDIVVGRTTGDAAVGALDGKSLSPVDSRLPFNGIAVGVFVS